MGFVTILFPAVNEKVTSLRLRAAPCDTGRSETIDYNTGKAMDQCVSEPASPNGRWAM
jgi:hypothetical protein